MNFRSLVNANYYIDSGNTTVTSYGSFKNILKVHSIFFKSLKYHYLTDDFLFVHAGIRPDKALNEQEKIDFWVIRNNFINHKHKLKQKVIFGHTPFETPFIAEDKIGINTGCRIEAKAPLTAYICYENRFISSD